MRFNDTITNSTTNKTVVSSFVRNSTSGSLVSTSSTKKSSSSASGKGTSKIDVITGSHKGKIKIYQASDTEAIQVPTQEFPVYDVTVEKQLPLYSEQNVSGGTTSTTTASTESHIILKFKTVVTPKDMAEADFIAKREDYLFAYEHAVVAVASLMFNDVKRMQFTDVSYKIPAGEENAYYDVTMEEVTDDEWNNATDLKNNQSVSTTTTNYGTQREYKPSS